ncbi:MAG: phosphodiester glycosidase family protein [Lentisphaerae bacterium]|nr:phosphodiester glycosidase family protein [Lentisphaerota bacterium]
MIISQLAKHSTRTMLLCVVLVSGCRSLTTPPSQPLPPQAVLPTTPAITINSHTLRTPRPIVIHVAQIDLSRKDIEIVSIAAPDPDATGPATTQLVTPTILFNEAELTLAVNANAFSVISPDKRGSAGMYVERAYARFGGLVAHRGKILSRPERHYVSFWLDERGRPNIGTPGPNDKIREGVAGFSRLLDNGALLPSPADHTLHPRTAVAFSADRRTLWLVVVDGREQGVSEGMTTFELAEYLQGLGAHNALNLDGGGSSVMLYAPPTETRAVARIINRPSTRFLGQPVLRPVPVLLGVRRKPVNNPQNP